MACNDDQGLECLQACRRAAIDVPNEVAIIGVDNDEYLCTLSSPPLSSIDVDAHRIGYESCRLLDSMIEGNFAKEHYQQLIPSGHVVIRQSSDMFATEDQSVVRALKFIQDHACEPIRLSDVVKHTAISRAALELRVKNILGHTIYQEIQRVRIEKVKELLRETDLSLKQIARDCGFRYTQHLARVFRKMTGDTLSQYRKTIKYRNGILS